VKCFEIEYNSTEWRVFIDSSVKSHRVILLHNANTFASIPIGHSVYLKENYNDLAMILEKVNYQEHQWMVSGYFKILANRNVIQNIPAYACGIVEQENSIGQKLTGHFEMP